VCFGPLTLLIGPQEWHESIKQDGHKPGKLRDFSEQVKLREFWATSGKNCNKQSIFSLSFKYLCKTGVDWVILLELMWNDP